MAKNLKSWFAGFLDKADDALDSLKMAVKKQFNLFDPLEVLVYNNYIGKETAHIFGRVLENKNIKQGEADDTAWDNLMNAYKRMNSDEVRGAKLGLSLGGRDYTAVSDEEGYFRFDIPVAELQLPEGNTLEIEVRLLDAPVPHEKNIVGKGKLYRPSVNAKVAIVSDIDDTILQTNATEVWSMLRNTFFENARTRRTFDGVSEWYQALEKGKEASAFQPIFYVSSSPWNLYDLLHDFITLHHIPEGVLLLRDYGVDETKIGTSTHGEHKYLKMKHLLESYPELSFVLIGDSGQHDAEIYRQVAEDYPGRVAAIYIRDAEVPEKKAWMDEQLAKAKEKGIEIVWKKDTLDMVRDAVAKGLVPDHLVQTIEQNRLRQ